MTTAPPQTINGHPRPERDTVAEPVMHDPIAQAEAEAISVRAYAEREAARIEAEAKAAAIVVKAEAEAEKQRIANERAAMALEEKRAAHESKLAAEAAKKAEADTSKKRAEDASAAEEATKKADKAEQQRSERAWKWSARGIYGVGLIIAAPVQFIDFWDPKRPFLIAAPALIEGFALVLAAGAAWAVAHKRDVLPYRIGIMFAAMLAAAINMRGGMTNPALGFNAGLIGAIASLGGPIVLMAYEHGIAQKVDGIPSMRERRASDKKRAADEAAAVNRKAEEAAAREKARAEKTAADEKAAIEKAEQQRRAEVEQQRKDKDRSEGHPEVWELAEAMRSARGSQFVTEQIWADAWYRFTGSKLVGITPEIEANSRAAEALMKTATETPIYGEFSQIESQKAQRVKRDPEAADGRRSNGGVPPRRVPGDTRPYSPIAKKQAALEQAATKPVSDASKEDQK